MTLGALQRAERGSSFVSVVKAAFAYFALVFGAGFLLGSVRVTFLVPRLGVRVAELAEMPLMLLVIVLSARFVSRRFALGPGAGVRLGMGFLSLVLLALAEFSLAALLGGQSPAEYVAGRDPVSGSVYVAMLCLFAAMPCILALTTRPVKDRQRSREKSP